MDLADDTVMTGVMIYELVRNKQLTGSVIATSPHFNYMIGPSSEVLINVGARFIPCVILFAPQCSTDFQDV